VGKGGRKGGVVLTASEIITKERLPQNPSPKARNAVLVGLKANSY